MIVHQTFFDRALARQLRFLDQAKGKPWVLEVECIA
jgi:hypothetical protein